MQTTDFCDFKSLRKIFWNKPELFCNKILHHYESPKIHDLLPLILVILDGMSPEQFDIYNFASCGRFFNRPARPIF